MLNCPLPNLLRSYTFMKYSSSSLWSISLKSDSNIISSPIMILTLPSAPSGAVILTTVFSSSSKSNSFASNISIVILSLDTTFLAYNTIYLSLVIGALPLILRVTRILYSISASKS